MQQGQFYLSCASVPSQFCRQTRIWTIAGVNALTTLPKLMPFSLSGTLVDDRVRNEFPGNTPNNPTLVLVSAKPVEALPLSVFFVGINDSSRRSASERTWRRHLSCGCSLTYLLENVGPHLSHCPFLLSWSWYFLSWIVRLVTGRSIADLGVWWDGFSKVRC